MSIKGQERKCFICGETAIDVSYEDMYFGCEKHIKKAKSKSKKDLKLISKIGLNAWLNRDTK